MKFLGIRDIEEAKRRISAFTKNTPVFFSSLLNKMLGHEIFFKGECMQKVGAFKARGACNTLAWLMENNVNPKHIVTNSSGNHAQAVAWAASQFGVSSTIFMPENTSKIKIQATSAYGAEIVFCKTRDETDKRVEEASHEKGVYWVPPFNHEQVISGQGTAAFEAIREIGEVDAVFAPCGGGGLLSGTLISSRALSPKAQVFGGEPLNGNDAAQSLRMKSIYKLTSSPDTIADGARTLSVGTITYEYLKQLDGLFEIEEQDIIYWAQWLPHLLKVQIEPTSALAMGAAVKWMKGQKNKKRILVILSGGNIDRSTFLKIWEKDYLDVLPSGLV